MAPGSSSLECLLSPHRSARRTARQSRAPGGQGQPSPHSRARSPGAQSQHRQGLGRSAGHTPWAVGSPPPDSPSWSPTSGRTDRAAAINEAVPGPGARLPLGPRKGAPWEPGPPRPGPTARAQVPGWQSLAPHSPGPPVSWFHCGPLATKKFSSKRPSKAREGPQPGWQPPNRETQSLACPLEPRKWLSWARGRLDTGQNTGGQEASMSTDPEVCPVPTGCPARKRDGLYVAKGAQRALGAGPHPEVDGRGRADHACQLGAPGPWAPPGFAGTANALIPEV